MKKDLLPPLLAAGLAALLAACSHLPCHRDQANSPALTNLIQSVKDQYAPDSHLVIFNLGLQQQGRRLALTGAVQNIEAKNATLLAFQRARVKVKDQIEVLPAQELGDRIWGIGTLSVANCRELPDHRAEMGTQLLMGNIVRVWKRATNGWLDWYLVQSADGYCSWTDKDSFVRCSRAQADAWTNSPLLIVTAIEERVFESPQPDSSSLSDVVTADLLKKIGEQDNWYKVELPDGRAGFLAKTAAEEYCAWKQSRRPTAENIERSARFYLGRPYLWGGWSPRGLDCSGFVKRVFFLNGIDLNRNASHQARQGQPVPLDKELSRLKKGDLLFFGKTATAGKPEKIGHVGIYLGGPEKLFIHSSEKVRINSLDPASPIRDENRIRTLLCARRILTE